MTSFNDNDNDQLDGDIDLDEPAAQDPSLDVDNGGLDSEGSNHEDDTNDGPADADSVDGELESGDGDAGAVGSGDDDSDGSGGLADNGVPQVPGKIPDGGDKSEHQHVHQALLYVARALQELTVHVADLDSNYAGLATELKQFFASFIGRLETVWQNGELQPSSDQLDSQTQFGHDPSGQSRNVY